MNYDIPWNPTRMMKRVGRINRIDTSFDSIYTYNFFNLFQKIKQKLPDNKFLWIRNNGSTIVSQLIDTAIFVPIAFLGEGLGTEVIVSIFISTYLIKIMVAALDTPFIYLAKKIKPIYED